MLSGFIPIFVQHEMAMMKEVEEDEEDMVIQGIGGYCLQVSCATNGKREACRRTCVQGNGGMPGFDLSMSSASV